MVDFGWSASCILEAIKLSNKIRKALQDAGGSKEQYAQAISFLMQFDCIFKELENHVRDGHGSSYREAIVQQLKLIEKPWTRLQELLGKYENSLGENSSRSRLNMVVKKVKWALKDLNEAVEKVKGEVLGPLHMVSFLLQMQSMKTIRSTDQKCQKIVDDLGNAGISGTLEHGIEDLYLHTNEQKRFHAETQTCFAQLQQSLNQQRIDIMGALQANSDLLGDQSLTALIEGSQQNEVLDSISKSMKASNGWKMPIEAIHDQLRLQQNMLIDVHEALQLLSNESKREACEGEIRKASAKNSFDTADAVSIVRVAATAASMFALGYATKAKSLTIKPTTSPPLAQGDSGSSSPRTWSIRKAWLAQFKTRAHTSPPPPRSHTYPNQRRPFTYLSREKPNTSLEQKQTSSNATVSQPLREQNQTSSNAAVSQPLRRSLPTTTAITHQTKEDYEWNCCHCNGGPYPKSRSSCWVCWTQQCTGCPLAILATPVETTASNRSRGSTNTNKRRFLDTQTAINKPVSTGGLDTQRYQGPGHIWFCSSCGCECPEYCYECPDCGSKL